MHEELPNSRFHRRVARITKSCVLMGPDGKIMPENARHMYQVDVENSLPDDARYIQERWIVGQELRKLSDLEVLAMNFARREKES